MEDFAQMVQDDYDIKRRGAIVKSFQANLILERLHQTLEILYRLLNYTKKISKP